MRLYVRMLRGCGLGELYRLILLLGRDGGDLDGGDLKMERLLEMG
jgi:hypothetical protein